VRAWPLCAVVLAAACQFEGGLGEEGLLCPTGECPSGQDCVDGVCTTGAAERPDGGRAGDGAPADGALADARPPGVNLVANPGMEEGTDPWTPYNAGLSESPDAHGGQRSLLVCNADVSGDFTVYQDVLKAPGEPIPAGESYGASVWVRSAGAAPGKMKLTIRESGGAAARVDHDGPVVDGISMDWKELEASGTVQEADRENLILIIWGLESQTGDCFAADDAVMVQQ
jgi:hypothetical protein